MYEDSKTSLTINTKVTNYGVKLYKYFTVGFCLLGKQYKDTTKTKIGSLEL